MLKGSGIHNYFGWKPVLKANLAGDHLYTVSIAGLDMARSHKMVFQSVATERIGMIVNNDWGANYSEAIHSVGRAAAAGVHAYSQATGATLLQIINQLGDESIGEVLFESLEAKLWLQAAVAYYQDVDNYRRESSIGIYGVAGPYTSFSFYTTGESFFTLRLQIFESVFAF